MKATVLAMMFLAVAFAHADNETDSSVKSKRVEAAPTRAQVEVAQAEMEVAQAEIEAARAQMEAARKELQAAAKRMAEASRQRLIAAQDRAFLGVLVGEQSTNGIVVAGVTPAGGAEAAGIESDDIIVAIDGESLTGHDRPLDVLYHVLNDVPSGGEVKLTVSRGGDVETYDVGTTPRLVRIEGHGPEFLEAVGETLFEGLVPAVVAPAAPIGIPERPWRGLMESVETTTQLRLVDIGEDLGDYFGVDSGVLVLNAPGKSELKPGDIVRRIDGADVASAAEARQLLAATSGEDAEVEVRRKNRKVDVTTPRGSAWRLHQFLANPKGKTAKIIIDDPEIDVRVEVEKDDDE